MFKSIKNIIILLLIIALVAIIPYICLQATSREGKNLSKETTIIINNNGKIEITDKIKFAFNRNEKIYVSIPQCLKAGDIWVNPKNINVKLDNQKLEYSGTNEKTSYFLSATEIVIRNIQVLKGHEYEAELKYEYNVSDVVEEYNNLSVLRLATGENISQTNIKIQLPQETNKFELKSNAKIEYLGNNKYNINGQLLVPYTELLMDKGIIENAKIVNEEYETSDFNRTLMTEESSIINIIITLLILTFICFGVILVLTKSVRTEKKYVREPDEVAEPILAEAIIDRKIGAKELIMSCIIELIHRGNLRNIGNDKVELINYEKMSEYEMEIIGLIFKEENQVVTFDEIKSMFLENNKNTRQFFDRFKVIKKKIEKKLFDYNLYSKLGENILKILKIISIDIILISIYVLFAGAIVQEYIVVNDMIKCVIICTIISIIISNIDNSYIKFILNNWILRVFIFTFLVGIIAIVISSNIGSYIIARAYKHLSTIILGVIIIALNIITIIKTKTHIFTQTGKIEFEKAQGLKNYIVDFSLMKDRDIESTIVWDEYLAYAVAFGIPNKITDKFNEGLMNTNVTLQKIESILKFE